MTAVPNAAPPIAPTPVLDLNDSTSPHSAPANASQRMRRPRSTTVHAFARTASATQATANAVWS